MTTPSPWRSPSQATRMRDTIAKIATDTVKADRQYRMAKVVTIAASSMEVEFTVMDEYTTTVQLHSIRPKASGQTVEIEIRNQTEYVLNRVFGDTVLVGSTEAVVLPLAPVGLALDNVPGGVTATWEPSVGARSYRLQRSKVPDFSAIPVTHDIQANQFTVSNLVGGDGWYFRVAAYNEAGQSDWSNVESIVITDGGTSGSPPSGASLLALDLRDRAFYLKWTPVSGSAHYEIQWATDAAFTQNLEVQVAQGSTFFRSGLTVGQTWHHRVRGMNTAGPGNWSNIVEATVELQGTPPAGPPVKVAGLALSSSMRALTAVWAPQAVADTYDIERAANSAFTVGSTTMKLASSTFTFMDLIEGQEWYVRVRAENSAGVGDWSDTKSAFIRGTVAPGSPGKVLNLTLAAGARQIVAKWDSVENVSEYEVQYGLDPSHSGATSEKVEGNQTTVTNLQPGTRWYFRVRGVNDNGNGIWSDTKSSDVPLDSEVTDGNPPENSPPTTVRPGLGMLIATWPVQANADRVTYEVHMAMTSGFTPTAATKLGETGGTFWSTVSRPDGSALQEGTTHFIRVVAKDKDGSATAGQQGSGIPERIDLGTAGDVHYSDLIGDGLVPPTPSAPSVSSGIGYLYATWPRAGGADPVEYEVHVSTDAAFIPDVNTLSLVTRSLFAFIRRQGPGQLNQNLEYGVTYFVRLVAVDTDGVSQPGPRGSGFTVQANTSDIAVNAITAASAIIADAAIGGAKIQDAAITTAKIGDLQVSTGKIGSLAVTNAKIADLAVNAAKIQDLSVTTAKISELAVTNAKIANLSAEKISTGSLFAQLTVSGSIRTANSGRRAEINSGGIFLLDDFGNAIVTMNATTGDVRVRGHIEAVNGTFTGNISSSATITGGDFNGGTFRTDRSTSGNDFIEIGNVGNVDPVDEIRMRTRGAVSSIRNPWESAGSIRFSTSHAWGATGAIYTMFADRFEASNASILAGGNITSNSRMYVHGIHEVYSPANPPQTNEVRHDGAYIGWSYLNRVGLYLGANNDTYHRLQIGVTGMDGPCLQGYSHVGLGVATYSQSVDALRITPAGNVYCVGNVQTNSTRSVKRQITPMSDAMTKIAGVKPVTYKRNDLPQDHPAYEDTLFGFVAEDMQHIFPELVGRNQDGTIFGLNYPGFVVPLTKVVQEILVRLVAIEGRIPGAPILPPIPPITPNVQ